MNEHMEALSRATNKIVHLEKGLSEERIKSDEEVSEILSNVDTLRIYISPSSLTHSMLVNSCTEDETENRIQIDN